MPDQTTAAPLASPATRKAAALATPAAIGLIALFALGGATGTTTAGTETTAQTPIVLAQATTTTPKAAAQTVLAQTAFDQTQTKAIEDIVRSYLLRNPEILVEVSRELERIQGEKQSASHAQLIVDNKAALFKSDVDFVLGNKDGDITVIEFFDYNCGWCKRAVGEINKLTAAEPQVRVVMKEFPIFGAASEFAARAAMAAKNQGKYWDFHVALMNEKRVSEENTLDIAKSVGLDVEKLKADMQDPRFDQALKETAQMAQALGIEGTPGFIVDNRVNVGYLPADGLKKIIGEVRAQGCKVC